MSALILQFCCVARSFDPRRSCVGIGQISPLKHQGIDGSKVLHQFTICTTLETCLAHCWFEPEHDGIEFEYFHPSGKDHPKFEARDETCWETLFHIRN